MLEMKQVLFVDDEVEVTKAIQRAIRKEPYKPFFAHSGEEAMEIMKKEHIHVLITDMKMPEIDGLTLLKYTQKHYPSTMRLVISGWSQSELLLNAINDGAVYRYIVKPWENRELKIIIRQALDVVTLHETNQVLMEQLQQKNVLLENEVQTRTRELIEARGQAEIGKYASEIVHNLKSPLNALSSELEVINFLSSQKEAEGHKILVSVEKAKSVVDDLKTIVMGILIQSSASKPFNTFPVQMNDIIEQLISFYDINPLFKNRIDVSLKLTKNLPPFYGNTSQIKQIVDNLISNAVDAMEDVSNRKLIIKTYAKRKSLLVEVSDSGVGILPEHMDKIFNPDFSTKSPVNATGLGLASVKTMVDAYMGKIRVHSKVGKGTTFTISFPFTPYADTTMVTV